MSKQFPVELVSVEAKVWSGQADMVVARTTEGELGVLAGHAPTLGRIAEPSRVRIKLPNGEEVGYDVSGGFLSVTESGVTVLAEDCQPASGPAPVPGSAAASAVTAPATH